MPRLLKIAQKSALVLTGVTIGAALWKTRAGANDPGEAGPLKESVTDLEFRLAALENGGLRNVSEDREHGSAAHTLSAVASLEASVAALTTRYDSRLTQLESRVGDHDAKLKEVPTLAQVVSTMEAMLSSTMSGLDQKLSEQVRSIDVLKTTVAQSDELMERVLDSIYSLQSHVAENDKSEVPVSV